MLSRQSIMQCITYKRAAAHCVLHGAASLVMITTKKQQLNLEIVCSQNSRSGIDASTEQPVTIFNVSRNKAKH